MKKIIRYIFCKTKVTFFQIRYSKSEIKIQGIEKSVIEKHARRGEIYEEAALRIKNKMAEMV